MIDYNISLLYTSQLLLKGFTFYILFLIAFHVASELADFPCIININKG